MQGQQLLAKQALARREAGGNVDEGPAAIGDHVVDAPEASGRVERVLVDFEPLQPCVRRRCRVVHSGHVSRDGSLVRSRDRMVGIAGVLLAADDVSPPRPDAVARLDIDHLVRPGPGKAASELLVVHIVDRVVGLGGAEADEEALVGPVHRDFLGERSDEFGAGQVPTLIHVHIVRSSR